MRTDIRNTAGLFLFLFVSAALGCGGDYRGISTSVSVKLGSAGNSIPANVNNMKFTISAPDMETIERTVSVDGRAEIVEGFDVPNGKNRRFLLEALDSGDMVVYRGDTFSDLEGGSKDIEVVMVPLDISPPSFKGLSSVKRLSETSVLLTWSPATDDVTAQANIFYLIYQSTSPQTGAKAASLIKQAFEQPTYVTEPGATSYLVTGLAPGVTYYFVVRAKDEAGNFDVNTAEQFVDSTPPVFAGIGSCSSSGKLLWESATDNLSPSEKITYLIFVSTSPTINYASPLYTTSEGATSYLASGLIAGYIYHFAVRAKDEAGNIDSNTATCSVSMPSYPPYAY